MLVLATVELSRALPSAAPSVKSVKMNRLSAQESLEKHKNRVRALLAECKTQAEFNERRMALMQDLFNDLRNGEWGFPNLNVGMRHVNEKQSTSTPDPATPPLAQSFQHVRTVVNKYHRNATDEDYNLAIRVYLAHADTTKTHSLMHREYTNGIPTKDAWLREVLYELMPVGSVAVGWDVPIAYQK